MPLSRTHRTADLQDARVKSVTLDGEGARIELESIDVHVPGEPDQFSVFTYRGEIRASGIKSFATKGEHPNDEWVQEAEVGGQPPGGVELPLEVDFVPLEGELFLTFTSAAVLSISAEKLALHLAGHGSFAEDVVHTSDG